MKKLIAISAAVIMVLGVTTLVHADPISTTKDVALQLTVGGAFGFEVWDTELSQVLDQISVGQAAFADIHIYATSSNAVPWYIEASSDGMIGQSVTPDTLPISMATFGDGLTGTTVTDLVLAGTPQHIYDAGMGEYPCAGLQFSALCIIVTDAGTQQDTYDGIITLTMAE